MADGTAQPMVQALYSKAWTRVFLRLTREAFGRMTDPQALAEDARQRLAMSLSRLEAAGESRRLSRAYIFIAFKRSLVDAYRELAGRPTPRKWLRELGEIGERLFELRCLMRLTDSEVLAALGDDPCPNGAESVDEAEVRRILHEMDSRRECDGRASEFVPLDGVDADGRPIVEPIAKDQDPADCLARNEALALRRLLYGASTDALPAALRERLEKLRMNGQPTIDLSDEEAFILRCFRDQIPERRVGELLGGLTVRQIRHRRQRALERMAQCLAAAEITLEDLLD